MYYWKATEVVAIVSRLSLGHLQSVVERDLTINQDHQAMISTCMDLGGKQKNHSLATVQDLSVLNLILDSS